MIAIIFGFSSVSASTTYKAIRVPVSLFMFYQIRNVVYIQNVVVTLRFSVVKCSHDAKIGAYYQHREKISKKPQKKLVLLMLRPGIQGGHYTRPLRPHNLNQPGTWCSQCKENPTILTDWRPTLDFSLDHLEWVTPAYYDHKRLEASADTTQPVARAPRCQNAKVVRGFNLLWLTL